MSVGQPSHPAGAPTDTSVDFDRFNRSWVAIVVAAVIAASLLGVFDIANTSVGWHLASGRWILENRAFITADPFSFTSGQAPWVDHEWLFQVGAAVAHGVAGAPALVILRALTVSILAVFLLVIGRRSGLAPPVALVVSIGCVAGASPRFFLRPELVTLVVVPLACWLYLTREQRASMNWLVWLGGIIAVSYTHLTLPTTIGWCRCRWWADQ